MPAIWKKWKGPVKAFRLRPSTANLLGNQLLSHPQSPPCQTPVPSAPALPLVRPAICTSAACEPPCSIGSLHDGTADNSSCASTIPINFETLMKHLPPFCTAS